MVVIRPNRRKAEKLPEDQFVRKLEKQNLRKEMDEEDDVYGELKEVKEIYTLVEPLPFVPQTKEQDARIEAPEVKEVRFENHAPLQADERAGDLVREVKPH